MAWSSPNSPNLLSLPVELRQSILNHVVDFPETSSIGAYEDSMKSAKKDLASLFCLSTQIRSETLFVATRISSTVETKFINIPLELPSPGQTVFDAMEQEDIVFFLLIEYRTAAKKMAMEFLEWLRRLTKLYSSTVTTRESQSKGNDFAIRSPSGDRS